MGKLLGIHPNEWKRFLVFFHLNFILAVGITIGSAASLSLFIIRYGVEHLPVVFMLTSVFTLFVMAIYNNFMGRISNEKLFLIILGINAAAILVMWHFVRVGFSPIYLLLYPGYSIITALSYNHTFVIVYDYFDARESKRLFPLIVSGVSLGGILGGFGVKALLKFTSTENLLLVWIVFMALTAAVVLSIRVFGVEGVEKKPAGRKKSSLGFFAVFAHNFRAVMRFPLVRVLILSTVTITIAFFIADFLSNKVFSQRFPVEADLTSFLGVFAGVSSLLGLILQVGVLPRLLARFGVAGTNFVYPGFMFAGLASLMVLPTLPSACLGYFNRKFLAYSVGEPVERLLYNALPPQMKGRASSFIKGYVLPLSTAAASLLILSVNSLFRGNERLAFIILSGIGFGVSLLNLYQRYVLKRLYASSLVSLVRERNIDLDALAEDWTKGAGDELEDIPVDEYLESKDEALYAMTLEFVRAMGLNKYASKLKAVFPDKSLEMQMETLKTLAKVDGAGQADFFLRLAREAGSDVRALSIQLLGDLRNDEILKEVLDFVHDADEKVQSAAITVVFQSGDKSHKAEAKKLLGSMLESESESEFMRGVGILVDTGDRRHIEALAALLDGRGEIARKRVIKAMCDLEDGEDDLYLRHFHELLRSSRGHTRGYVVDAIKKVASEESVPFLFAEIENMTVTNRIKTVKALGAIGLPAIDSLTSILRETNQIQEVRIACMERLDKFPAGKTKAALDAVGKREIVFVYMLVQLRMKLAGVRGRHGLLDFVIDEMIRHGVGIWLHIIARMSRKPSDVIMLIAPLFGSSKTARADSIETLESLIDKNSYGLVLPIFDRMSDRERLAAAGKQIDVDDLPAFDLYVRVMRSAPPEHRACMLFAMDSVSGDAERERKAEIIEEAFNHRSQDVIEAALVAVTRNGIAERFEEAVAPYRSSESERLRDAAECALKTTGEGEATMLSTFEKIMFLKKVGTFAGLDSHALKVLSGISSVVEFSHGEVVFEEGDQGDAMYVIQKGSVRLSHRGKPLAVLGESDYFGEMAVLDGEPRSAGAAADTDCRLIRIQRDHFIELIHEYPMITIPIFQALSHRLRLAQQ